MAERICKRLLKLCDVFEIIISIIVGFGLAATLITYIVPSMLDLFQIATGTEHFLEFLENIFNLVVGLEFMKMLCKPSSDNVIEVLVFLVSRHMILGANSALDIFLSVLSVSILFIVRRLLHIIKYRDLKWDLTGLGKNKNLEQEQAEKTE